MAKVVEGIILFAKFEKAELFNWQDPATGQTKPIRSVKVLLAHGDGTVSRESLSIPPDMAEPKLNPGEVYGFRVSASVSKKRQTMSWTLVPGAAPLPALELE